MMTPRDRLNWIDAIAVDVRVSPEAFRLAHVLQSRFVNSKTGEAWPAQETLGQLLGIGERQARKLIAKLVECGYIEVRRGGKGKANRYRLTGTPSSDQELPMTGTPSAGHDDGLTGTPEPLDRNSEGRLTGTHSSAYLAETSMKNSGPRQAAQRESSTFNEGQRSTVDVVETGETRAEGASPSPNKDRRVYVGLVVDHRTYGRVVVERLYPETRSIRIRLASGRVCTLPVMADVELVDAAPQAKETWDEIPF